MNLFEQARDYLHDHPNTYEMNAQGRIPIGDVIKLMRAFHLHMAETPLDLSEALRKCREHAESIRDTRFGWEGDGGTKNLAEDIIDIVDDVVPQAVK